MRRNKAPRMVDGGERVGDLFVVDGAKTPVAMGLVAAAGKTCRRSASTECASRSCTERAGIRLRGWPPVLAEARRRAVAAAERVLRREHLRHLPRRLDRVPLRGRDELAAPDVGERLPNNDSTWPWSHELLEKHTAHLSGRQQRSILCDNVAERRRARARAAPRARLCSPRPGPVARANSSPTLRRLHPRSAGRRAARRRRPLPRRCTGRRDIPG